MTDFQSWLDEFEEDFAASERKSKDNSRKSIIGSSIDTNNNGEVTDEAGSRLNDLANVSLFHSFITLSS